MLSVILGIDVVFPAAHKRPASPTAAISARPPKKSNTGGQRGKKQPKPPNPNAEQPRNRWSKVDSELMPFPVPVWYDRLTFVGRELNLTGREKPKFTGVEAYHSFFMMPEAGMIASVKNERTRALFLNNFCRLIDLLEYNALAALDDILGRAETAYIHPQKWRLVLSLTEASSKKEGTRGAAKRKEVEELMQAMGNQHSVCISVFSVRLILTLTRSLHLWILML